MIDKALISGVEGAVEEEFEIVGRRRRRRTMEQAGDVEKSLDVDSIVEEEEEEGCLEKLPGWVDKLQEPFLPDIELRLYHRELLVFQRFKGNIKTILFLFQYKSKLIKPVFGFAQHISKSPPNRQRSI